jgi:hypothetical protein
MSGTAKLKPKQEEAIPALFSNRTVEDAARAIKIAPRTLYRWMRESDFNAAYREARGRHTDSALRDCSRPPVQPTR